MALPDIDSFASLAGKLNDYSDVVDPTVDLPADAGNTTRANVAGMTRMLERVFVIWSNDGTDGTVAVFDSVIGNDAALYPVITKIGTGHWRMTWTPGVIDMLGRETAWSFRHALGEALHSEPIKVQCVKTQPNAIDVYMWVLPAATANDVAGVSLLVRVY